MFFQLKTDTYEAHNEPVEKPIQRNNTDSRAVFLLNCLVISFLFHLFGEILLNHPVKSYRFLALPMLSGIARYELVDLFQIMHHAVQQPLRTYLLFAPQGEEINSINIFKFGKLFFAA